MASNNIRSQYVQQILEDKNSLEEKLKEVTQSTVTSIIGEKVENKIRKILSEGDDSFIEDEVDDVKTDTGTDVDDETADTTDTDTEVTDDTEVLDKPVEDGDETKTGDDTVADTEVVDDTEGADDENADLWNDLEQYQGEDGEYDLTGMDADAVIKVMQVLKPEDGVRVVKNDNGTITLSDDETEKEYIIDVDCSDESGADDAVEENKKPNCNETDLGYTDNFQNKTAMTTPSNNEPANPKTTYSMDGGAPTGTEKRWANKGDKAPFDEDVNEEVEFEIECDGTNCDKEKVDETMTTQEQGPYNRGNGMVHTNTNIKAAKGRNAHAGGQQISGTADNSYSEAKLESIKRKANVIFNENKELKALVPQMKQQLMEAIVINKSMGNLMKIVMENSTSLNEKKEIFARFSGVKTIEESDNLYKTISEELKREGKTINVNNVINSQLAESKNNIVETPMYQSDDLSQTLSLMKRMSKL